MWSMILGIFFPPVWPIIIYKLVRYNRKAKIERPFREQAINAFASQNGYEVRPMKFGLISDSQKLLLDLPFLTDDFTVYCGITGKLHDLPFSYQMGSVHVRLSDNPNDTSQYPYLIFQIDLPVTLPRMFLNSKQNDLKGLDAKPLNFEQKERHNLEGNFPNYYSVTIEQDKHINMYTTLTPEVMQALVENNMFDVWVNGKQLMLITFADEVRYFAGIPAAFKNAELLLQEIDKTARALRNQKA